MISFKRIRTPNEYRPEGPMNTEYQPYCEGVCQCATFDKPFGITDTVIKHCRGSWFVTSKELDRNLHPMTLKDAKAWVAKYLTKD
jgi:hypothetical protein